jgi:hypothetical protein
MPKKGTQYRNNKSGKKTGKKTLMKMWGGVSPSRKSVKKTTTNSPNDKICALCHKSFSHPSGSIAEIKLNCGHKFHKKCLMPVIRLTPGVCPICNHSI